MPTTSIAALLQLLTREPGRPRITWYGDDGERVELSGAVLENWVNKTANLLVEEFDAGPGTRVDLHLPGHWRTLVWALAAWRLGACVTVGSGADADVAVTTAPADVPAGPAVIAVSLPALARTFAGDLPSGTMDAASAVMTYSDALGWTPTPEPARPALVDGAASVAHDELLVHAQLADHTGRVLLGAPPVTSGAWLLACVAPLVLDGSVVLAGGSTLSGLLTDTARRERIVSTERVTADLLGPATPTESP